MTAAQIRDAARLVGAEATAENCLHRTGEVAEVWVAGFIAGLEAANAECAFGVESLPYTVKSELLEQAREAAETVGTP
jgi:hypothetical protein